MTPRHPCCLHRIRPQITDVVTIAVVVATVTAIGLWGRPAEGKSTRMRLRRGHSVGDRLRPHHLHGGLRTHAVADRPDASDDFGRCSLLTACPPLGRTTKAGCVGRSSGSPTPIGGAAIITVCISPMETGPFLSKKRR